MKKSRWFFPQLMAWILLLSIGLTALSVPVRAEEETPQTDAEETVSYVGDDTIDDEAVQIVEEIPNKEDGTLVELNEIEGSEEEILSLDDSNISIIDEKTSSADEKQGTDNNRQSEGTVSVTDETGDVVPANEQLLEETSEFEELSEPAAMAGEDYIVIDANTFPDPNFRAYVLELMQDSLESGNRVSKSALASVKSIAVGNKNISSLVGLEFFTSLTELICWNNNLTSLDVSQNRELIVLFCWDNFLTSLDVSENTALCQLDCRRNQLSSLIIGEKSDGIYARKYLDCAENNLSSLDVSKWYDIGEIDVYDNPLHTLKLPKGFYQGALRLNYNTEMRITNDWNGPHLGVIAGNEIWWSKVPGAAEYKVYAGGVGEEAPQVIGSVNYAEKEFVAELKEGLFKIEAEEFDVWVVAYSSSGEELEDSNIVTVPAINDGVPFDFTFRAADDGFSPRQDTAVFRSDYFKKLSTTYNQELALISLQMALAAFNKSGSEKGVYDTASDNIKHFFDKIGCGKNAKYSDTYFRAPTKNSIGLAAGHRSITVGGTEYTLIALAIRGGGYEAEWGGNFNVGTGDHHAGFYKAAKDAYNFLDDYITDNNISGSIKIWISGYSRAAATANILGGAFLDNGKNRFSNGTVVPTDQIYVYTFETPRGVQKSLDPNNAKFDNIFNIINPDDPVPKFVPENWGYRRYGVDCFLNPSKKDGFSILREKYNEIVPQEIMKEPGKELFKEPYRFQSGYLDNLVGAVASLFGKRVLGVPVLSPRDDYVQNHQTPFVNACEENKGVNARSLIAALLGDETALASTAVNAVSFFADKGRRQVLYAKMLTTEAIFEVVNVRNGLPDFEVFGFHHYPELCLAWMKYLTERTEIGSFWDGRYKYFSLKCPVDASVYVGGNLVAEIRNDEVITQTDDLVYAIVDPSGMKTFYLMTDEEYEIVASARDEGTMNVVVTEYSLSDGIIEQNVFRDIPLNQGQEYTSALHGGNVDTDTYSLTDGNTSVMPDEILGGESLYKTTILHGVEGEGETIGSGEYTNGELAVCYAIPADNHTFIGWKDAGGKWVSREAEYRFLVKEDVSLTAVFEPVKVTGVGLSVTSVNLTIGSKKQLTATIKPENAHNKEVNWKSSNTSVATVSSTGLVKGIKAGSATITVTTKDGSKTAACKVTVTRLSSAKTQEELIREFVTRSYDQILGRKPDSAGLNYWVGELKARRIGGGEMVAGFLTSREFINRKLSNDAVLDIVYKSFMDRKPDANGKAYWKDFMENGLSIRYVAAGFTGSKEFKGICDSYGITPGKVTITENRDQNAQVTKFVWRCYRESLGRDGDIGGINYWTGEILAKRITPAKVAEAFVFSREMNNKGYNNSQFVQMLYRLCMGRTYDRGGLNYWLGEMNKGMTRAQVFTSFVNSREFQNIVKSYGL